MVDSVCIKLSYIDQTGTSNTEKCVLVKGIYKRISGIYHDPISLAEMQLHTNVYFKPNVYIEDVVAM